MPKNILKIRTNGEKLNIRYETLDGVKYLVAPVVMVKEQVLNGEFLPAEEIEKSTIGWNGRPVVVYHPEDNKGESVIANDPDVIPNYQIGTIFNTQYDPETTKLRAEVWIDIKKARTKNNSTKEALEMIKKSDELEVSTGYIVNDRISANGEYDGVPYTAIQRQILPDHLALLPQEIGACSWEDGGGVRNNSSLFSKIKYKLRFNAQTSINESIFTQVKCIDKNVKGVTDLIYDDEGNSFAIYDTKLDDTGETVTFKVPYIIEDNIVQVINEPQMVRAAVQYLDEIREIETRQQTKTKRVSAKNENKGGKRVAYQKKDQKKVRNSKKVAGKVKTNSAKEIVKNKAFKSRKFKTNEGEEMLVEELLMMDDAEVIATIESLDEATIMEVEDVLEEVIVACEVIAEMTEDNAVASEAADIANEAASVIDIIEADDSVSLEDEDDEAIEDNVSESEIYEGEGEEEDELVSDLETASSRRRKVRTNKTVKKAKPSLEQYIAGIPDKDVQSFIINGANAQKQHRENLIKTLARNSKCTLNRTELSRMDTSHLEKISAMVNPEADYSLQGFATNSKESDMGYTEVSYNMFDRNKRKGGK